MIICQKEVRLETQDDFMGISQNLEDQIRRFEALQQWHANVDSINH